MVVGRFNGQSGTMPPLDVTQVRPLRADMTSLVLVTRTGYFLASHKARGASTPGATSRGASTPNLFEHIVEACTT